MNSNIVSSLFLLAVFCASTVNVNGASAVDECSNELQKVTACLGFATGKATNPTKECCGAVSDIKDKYPVCLCYVIQQIHNGTNPALKSMGIKEELLLQLPSACELANASSAECPKLLKLSPNSPEASIFSDNVSAPATPAASAVTGSSSTSPTGGVGCKLVPGLPLSIAITILVLFCIAFFT